MLDGCVRCKACFSSSQHILAKNITRQQKKGVLSVRAKREIQISYPFYKTNTKHDMF